MVPRLPFVLINGKTDLPRIGNKKHHWRTYKKENVGKYISPWLQTEQRIFQM